MTRSPQPCRGYAARQPLQFRSRPALADARQRDHDAIGNFLPDQHGHARLPFGDPFLSTLKETAMHPIISRELMKARTSDWHRQAEHEALARAAGRARHAPAKHSKVFMPAHTAAALIPRVLTLLGARRPGRSPVPANPVQPGRPG